MKLTVVFLLIVSLCMAFTVKPSYIAVKNTGNESLEAPTVGLLIDCNTKQLQATITSEEEQPIPNAKTYIFYTDYGYQLIGTGSTNQQGVSTINVIGNMNYLTALFIFRVDSPGYRSQEIEFTYKKCFEPPPQEEPPIIVPEENDSAPLDEILPENDSLPPQMNDSEPPQNEPPLDNQPPPQYQPTSACPLGVLLLLALIHKAS